MSTGTSAPRKKEKTRKERMDEAFAVATRGIEVDIPMLLHGSLGGSLNSSNPKSNEKKFDPELTAIAARDTHRLIAALTTQYIHRLVDAALDVRDMQLFGDPKHVAGTRQLLPPQPLESLYQPQALHQIDHRKRSAVTTNSWDKPLPKPKIRGRSDSRAVMNNDEQMQQPANNDVGIDQWVGALGIDMWQHSRARATYTQHRTITAQHFIFPLCHDSYLYGRIREVQTTKNNVIEPLLHDTAVWDVILTEGQLQHEEIHRSRRMKNKKKKQKLEPKRTTTNSDEDSDEDTEESDLDEVDAPTWPGLDRLLPANRLTINKECKMA